MRMNPVVLNVLMPLNHIMTLCVSVRWRTGAVTLMFFTNPFASRDIAPPLAGPVVTENNLCAPYVSALETPFLERMYQNPRRSSTSTMLNMQQLAGDQETIEGGKTEDNFPLGPTVSETFKDFRRQKDRRKKEAKLSMSKAGHF